MNYLKAFFPLLFFLCLNASAVFAFGKQFGRMLPLTMISAIFTLYASQLFLGSFSAGWAFLWGAAAASLPLGIRRLKTSGRDFVRDTLFSEGLAAFLIIFFAAAVLLYGKHFRDWDEYSHWGMMVKEMLRLNRFYCVPE